MGREHRRGVMKQEAVEETKSEPWQHQSGVKTVGEMWLGHKPSR